MNRFSQEDIEAMLPEQVREFDHFMAFARGIADMASQMKRDDTSMSEGGGNLVRFMEALAKAAYDGANDKPSFSFAALHTELLQRYAATVIKEVDGPANTRSIREDRYDVMIRIRAETKESHSIRLKNYQNFSAETQSFFRFMHEQTHRCVMHALEFAEQQKAVLARLPRKRQENLVEQDAVNRFTGTLGMG